MNENGNQIMTVRDAVESIIKDLGNVPVPVSQMEAIGLPIARAIQNLKNVCAAWDADEAEKAKQAQQKEPEISLDVVPEEEVPESVREEEDNG